MTPNRSQGALGRFCRSPRQRSVVWMEAQPRWVSLTKVRRKVRAGLEDVRGYLSGDLR